MTALRVAAMSLRAPQYVIARAAVAVSSLGSALAIAMMVGSGGTPPFAALLGPDWCYYSLIYFTFIHT